MKTLLSVLILLCLERTFAQDPNDPVLHMGNISNPFDVDGSGTPFTSYSFEIKGFDDLDAGIQGAQSLLDTGRLTIVEDPCADPDNRCVQECTNYELGVYQCHCSKGYEDATTEAVEPSTLPQKGFVCEDIDECLEPNPCGAGQENCTNTVGSYICECSAGYQVSADGESCEDYDECANETLNNCHEFATCINTNGSFVCECNQGYQGDGLSCVDIDECAVSNVTCGPRGECSNIEGSYRCDCDMGFEEDNSTGTPTCSDFDECAEGDRCLDVDNAMCVNTDGSFACDCQPGFVGDGLTNCTDVDECASFDHGCHMNATCTNTEGNYTCECEEGFLGDGFDCNAGEMSYCFRAKILGRVDLIRSSIDANTQIQMRSALSLLFTQYRFSLTGFFVNGFNVTVEDSDPYTLVLYICFNRISKTNDELAEIFIENDPNPTNRVNGQFWAIRDIDECDDNYLNCHEESTCENTNGDAICTCADNRYDNESDGGRTGIDCMEPIEFDCDGSKANISLLVPYWSGKYIDVKNVFVNQGCAGVTDGDSMWHNFVCDGDVSANGTHLIAAFRVADVIPEGGFAINRLDTTFQCIQPAQQNFTSNITAEDNIVDPGVDLVDNAESSLKPLVFLDGFENAVVRGVKTGEKACVKLEDPNIPENIKIMIEELHSSAPGDDNRFTLLENYCPVEIPGIEIETSNGGICFTMHRPQASELLEVHMVVNLCTVEDCPTPSCSRKRRSLALSRSKRSEDLQAISFLIQIDPDDTCDRDCGVGACLPDFLNQEQCICPESSYKLDDGKCKANKSNSTFGDSSSFANFNYLILVLVVLVGLFIIAVAGFVVFYARRRNALLVNDKQLELRGYTNNMAGME